MAGRLAVILPLYNVAAYLPACLDSLRAQTLADLDVVMVDDGSTDATAEIASRYAAADGRFRLISQPNAGCGPARNLGASESDSPYLTFLDGDDLVPPRALEALVTSLERTDSDFAAGNARRFCDRRMVRESWLHQALFSERFERTHVSRFPGLARDRMIWNKVFRRSFYERQGFQFLPIRCQDYPVTLRAHLEADAVDVVAEVVYYWRIRGSGDSATQRSTRPDHLRDRLRSAHLVLDAAQTDRRIWQVVSNQFMQIDVPVFANAIADAPAAQRPSLFAQARAVVRRLRPTGADVPAYANAAGTAIGSGSVAEVLALESWRLRRTASPLLRESLRSVPRLYRAQRLLREVANQAPGEVSVVDSEVVAASLRLTLDWPARGDGATQATLRLGARGYQARVHRRSERCRAGFSLPLNQAIGAADRPRLAVELSVRDPGGSWRAVPKAYPKRLPAATRFRDGWLHLVVDPLTRALSVGWSSEPAGLVEIKATPDKLTLRIDGFTTGQIEVVRPAPSAALSVPVRAGRAELDLADVLADDPPDDPVNKVSSRALRLVCPDGVVRPLLLAADPVKTAAATHQVEVHRDHGGAAVLLHWPVRPQEPVDTAHRAGDLSTAVDQFANLEGIPR